MFRKINHMFTIFSLLVCLQLSAEDYNADILESISKMPKGLGYKNNADAAKVLRESVTSKDGKLVVDVNQKAGNFCSGATYLVFLTTLQKLQDQGKIAMNEGIANNLKVKGSDGSGVWGRWNANGPGTAGLFSDFNLGYNFTDDNYEKSKPGDFVKIFWKDVVGTDEERGHSVILTRFLPPGSSGPAVKEVCFWSSNSGVGYGEKCKKKEAIKHAIFSRLSKPQNINSVAGPVTTNPYLASLVKNTSTFADAVKKTNTFTGNTKDRYVEGAHPNE